MTHREVIFFEGQRYDRMTPQLRARITAHHKNMLRTDGTRRPYYEISGMAAIAHAQHLARGLAANRSRALRADAPAADSLTALQQIDTAVGILAARMEHTPAGRSIARQGPAGALMSRCQAPNPQRRPAARTSRPANWWPPGATGLSDHGKQVFARAVQMMLNALEPDQIRMLANATPQELAAFAAKVADFADGVLYFYAKKG